MAIMQDLQEFSNAANETRNVVVSGTGTATLEAADGVGGWVAVPDGALVAPTTSNIRAAAGDLFRFNFTSGTPVVNLSQ